jgi:uncharacterized protein
MARLSYGLLRFFYPLGLLFYKLAGLDQDRFKRFFININNKITVAKIKNGKIGKKQILFILPHCLQDSECNYRITGNKILNCKSCGKCIISEIKKLKEEFSLNIEIATGGNAARNTIKELRPALIFAVACENDLASGIFDISRIPVIGLLNCRPNGPCRNTTLDIGEFKRFIETIGN